MTVSQKKRDIGGHAMLNETWKAVVGYEGIYEVSDIGRVRSLDRPGRRPGWRLKGKILKQTIGSHGYLTVNLHNRAQITRTVHGLVAQTFFGPRPYGQEARHGVHGRLDNSVENLEYGTHKENEKDKIRDQVYSAGVAVICDNSTEFESIAEAAKATKCQISGIVRCCQGKLKQSGGHIWSYKHADN